MRLGFKLTLKDWVKIKGGDFKRNLLLLLNKLLSENYFTSSNIKYIDNQLVTVIKIQMICKCKYKTI